MICTSVSGYFFRVMKFWGVFVFGHKKFIERLYIFSPYHELVMLKTLYLITIDN